jgi:hypothetical protein
MLFSLIPIEVYADVTPNPQVGSNSIAEIPCEIPPKSKSI